MTTSTPLGPTRSSKGTTQRTAIVAAALVVGLVGGGALVLRGTEAVFTANVTNGSNTWAAGSVGISTDLAATVMFSSSDDKLVPNTTINRCIELNYTGDVAAAVKLYTSASTDTDGLGAALTFTLNEGTGTAGADCAGFTPATQLYTGSLATFLATKNSYANGVSSWTPSSSGTKKMYRFTVTLPSGASSSLQGAVATATFRWEAQAGS